ncbi:MAG: flagellar basal body P-ring protein FlgI [Gammaproteobacteria bacterium]|nr:flagellar basal body P-ring protein FlgI [Gammaproteobacteria bacterium]MDH3448361.1 flagellar basal body P-ring protein FlgI [Gammaproteobacteria bacterium]
MKLKKTIIFLILLGFLQPVWAERIKDITSIKGVRSNQLVGYGLVVGLDGSGDQTSQTPFTVQSLKSMLSQYGITLPPNVNPQVKNVAAVSVHADLPPFAKIGQTIDVTVSSLGNAKSLRGGSLLMTPLKGADGNIYAMAQGNLIVGGLGVEGADGSSVTINIPSVGRIPSGASIEREIANPFASGDKITLHLERADFTTAKRLADTINQILGPNNARAQDSVTVAINAPQDVSQRVGFMSFIENLEFQPGEAPARVIINSRSGTVVIGNHVKVYSAAVSHGNLSVTITNTVDVTQPGPFSGGTTTENVQSDIEVSAENNRMFRFPQGVTLSEIVRAVNQVGASPGDLVAILESLKQVGALSAELIVI